MKHTASWSGKAPASAKPEQQSDSNFHNRSIDAAGAVHPICGVITLRRPLTGSHRNRHNRTKVVRLLGRSAQEVTSSSRPYALAISRS